MPPLHGAIRRDWIAAGRPSGWTKPMSFGDFKPMAPKPLMPEPNWNIAGAPSPSMPMQQPRPMMSPQQFNGPPPVMPMGGAQMPGGYGPMAQALMPGRPMAAPQKPQLSTPMMAPFQGFR